MPPLRLGTRGSVLARLQTQEVAEALAAQNVATSELICSTQGDRDSRTSLLTLGGQGVFVRELEMALLDGRIDAAVHSAKDVPTDLTDSTALVAFLPRADVRDVLVSRNGALLAKLPPGARIGSGSRRRQAQLLAQRPDCEVVDIRGNVDTRLRKLADGAYDAIVLAAAGLERLGRLEVVTEFLRVELMLPSPGQGTITLQARSGDDETVAALRTVNHAPTALAVRAERAVLRALGAGCSLPVAALANLRGDVLRVVGRVAAPCGTSVIDAQHSGLAADPEAVGTALGETLLARGAAALLSEVVS